MQEFSFETKMLCSKSKHLYHVCICGMLNIDKIRLLIFPLCSQKASVKSVYFRVFEMPMSKNKG